MLVRRMRMLSPGGGAGDNAGKHDGGKDCRFHVISQNGHVLTTHSNATMLHQKPAHDQTAMPDYAPYRHPLPSARELISAHGGRVTRTRIAVIETLQAGQHPLSHDEIGAALTAAGVVHDRVTLYRALDWLVEQGIAQRIAGGERAWRFEIRHDGAHRHAHFHCDRCGQILCLEEVPTETSPALPAGFELDRTELVLHGACADCGRQGAKAGTR